ncbi:hypothetical protein, partial [Xanthomonas translucens]|uniref:hypothetical protein n=1 Tax=Xanthomonas campestris pv. translucens TaxID=343 RepID=UPI0035E6C73F
MTKLETMMMEFVTSQKDTNQQIQAANQQLHASIRNVENSVSQLAKEAQQRNQGTLPSNAEPNPV